MMEWSEWLKVNYKYVVMGAMTTDEERCKVLKLEKICEKYGVPFKTYCDILAEFGKEDSEV